ncbi:MAG: hypothetical protein IGR80_09165 [Synechococcales cyanobacterium K44_A2020_017]|nr:hypothetical protein [Synechococcales cyanobacterium K32_A2020_035]MBF2094914.1 hypothetical protein [Synechococcales cyanobacterium K44_A2020_017]
MNSQKISDLEKLLNSLENIIKEARLAIAKSQPPTHLIESFKSHIDDLAKIFILTESDLELEHKKYIYSNIAKFVKDKIDNQNNSLDVCLKAVYSLCGETDAQLVDIGVYNSQTDQIIAALKAVIMSIRIHYTKTDVVDTYSLQTEIIVLMSRDGNPKITRIEEEVSWDDLPSEVRHSFFKEDRNSVSFQIYPQE